ncbi:hypothetical protein HLA97_17580 [Gordonia araii NBRC 100433]|nr:hypothetical protein [Gordonia araii]NNG99048.1 hypothetical protein [Gordonia araii NBRC 100433]
MAIYDFVSWGEQELVAAVKLDRAWHDLQGFTFELDDHKTIAHETLRFVAEWEIAPDERSPLVLPEDWYAED